MHQDLQIDHGLDARSLLPVLSAGILLLAVPSGMPASQAVPQTPAEGQWRGGIQTPGGTLEVVVDLEASAAGDWTGQIDIPAQGVEDRALGEIAARGDSVRFTIPGIPGEPTFRGVLAAESDSLVGDFSQGGRTFPFRLARSGPPQIATGPDPRKALEGFDETVRTALEAFHVPGAAVAVVREGEVVLARGYGVRNQETGAAVTDSTLFPIGSMTKSFTSLLVGLLVDEGRLSWTEPVQDRLPGFRLARMYPGTHATPVDLLSHRTGLPRHDLLWLAWEEADTVVTRDDYVRTLRHLPFTSEFRTEFHYNNFLYMTAGRLVGRVTGTTWEEQLRRRILEPLGMRRTNVRADSLLARPDRAAGYRVVHPDSGEARTEPMDYFRIDAMAPAGAINSSAREMARWLELQMAGGRVDGEQVLPRAVVERTHRPVVPVTGGGQLGVPEVTHPAYAMGWESSSYRGHTLLVHGGGIDGFTSLMGVLPEDELGVVVLTNRLGGRFTSAVLLDAVDRLLGLERKDWVERFRRQEEQARAAASSGAEDTARAAASPAHPLQDYAGSYRHPAYGTLRISNEGDALVARLGALTLDLEHRHYEVFDGDAANPLLEEFRFAFQFQTDRNGDVAAVTVPVEPTLEPLRFEREPSGRLRDPAFLEKLTGEYRVAGMTVEIRLRGDGTLVFEQPGATADLVPRRGTRFMVRGQEGITVEFVLEAGEATGIVIHQAGQRYEGEKVSDTGGAERGRSLPGGDATTGGTP